MPATDVNVNLTGPQNDFPRVLVLGDLTLNFGSQLDLTRGRPSASRAEKRPANRRLELGGAANACRLLRLRKFDVTCAGYVGQDDLGRILQRMLDIIGVNRNLVFIDNHRPTVVVERSRAQERGPQPAMATDIGTLTDGSLPPPCEDQLLLGLCGSIQDHQALLISDDGHGVCTPRLLRAAIRVARQMGIPVLVDPLCSRTEHVAQSIEQVAAARADQWNLERWLNAENSQSRAA